MEIFDKNTRGNTVATADFCILFEKSQVAIFFRGILRLCRNGGRFVWAEKFSLFQKMGKTEIFSRVNEAITIFY